MQPFRRLFLAPKGHLGNGSQVTEPGDNICVLYGGQRLFALHASNQKWVVVGECFVPGMKDVTLSSHLT